jgi:hypothetical protein
VARRERQRPEFTSPSSVPRPRRARPDPVNLFGAAKRGRTIPEPPRCPEELAKVKRILEQQQSVKKTFAQKERTLTLEAINL